MISAVKPRPRTTPGITRCWRRSVKEKGAPSVSMPAVGNRSSFREKIDFAFRQTHDSLRRVGAKSVFKDKLVKYASGLADYIKNHPYLKNAIIMAEPDYFIHAIAYHTEKSFDRRD